ncbi:DUF6531 domain-containing protein, partial [Defluviitalea phaphyphila]|uniref:DUF6531 domain-containing protein n=1 Tax=Defluviitalea phaphyphila TaxID=1473580 RepID=UPI000B1D394C
MKFKYKNLEIDFTRSLKNITDFKITKEINQHTRLYIKGIVPDYEKEKYALEINLDDKIKVVNLEDENVIFCGSVDDICIKMVNNVYYIEIEAVSYTYDLDIKKKYRSFQDLNMTYRDVIKEVLADYKQVDFIDTVTNKEKIKDIIVQYNETDWEFIKRLASHFNAGLVVDEKEFFPRFYFGLPKRYEINTIETPKYKREKNLEDYIKTAVNFNSSIKSWDKITYKIETYTYLDICEKIKYRNEPLVITKAETYVKKEELLHRYILSTQRGASQNFIENKNIQGAKIEGIVKEISRNKMRVHLNIDKEYKEKNNKFIPYAGGINNELGYYMPKIGSSVYVYFPNTNEGNAIITECIRKGSAGHDRMQDPREKHLRNEFGKEVRLGHKDMEFTTGNDDIKINMTKDGVIDIHSPKSIEIKAETNINIGEQEEIESYVKWIEIPNSIAENININAGKELKIQVGDYDFDFLFMDEESYIFERAHKNIKIEGSLKKPPLQDYSEEINKALEEDKKALEDIREQIEKAAKKSARQKLFSGLKALAIGVAAVGFAVATIATGGATLAVAGAVLGGIAGGVTALAGASNIIEGVTSFYAISKGDYSGGYNPLRDSILGGNQELFDAIMYGGCFISELFISFAAPATLPKSIATLFKGASVKTAAGGALGGGGQALSDILNGQISSFVDYIKAAERGSFTGFLSSAIPGPPCGSSKWVKLAHTQLSNAGMDAINELTETGGIDLKRFTINQLASFGGASIGNISNSSLGRYIGEVIGDTTGDVTYVVMENQGISNLSAEDKKYIIDNLVQSFIFNGIQARYGGEPIEVVRGPLSETFTDIVIKDIGLDLEIRRFYNSKNHRVSQVGKGWNINIGSCIVKDEETLLIQLPDSSVEMFERKEGNWVNIRGGTKFYNIIEDSKTGYFIMTAPDKKTYYYNERGNLSLIKDNNDNAIKINYIEDTDIIDTITTTGGKKLKFTYSDNKIKTIEDNIGRTIEYTYDGDLLIKSKDFGGGITRYEYNQEGYISAIIDANGIKYVENKYDKKGRVIWQRFGNNEEVKIYYDDKNKENTFHYLNENRKEKYKYNEDLLATKITYDDKTTEEFEYDQWGNKIKIKDRNGNITKQTYDINGNLLSKTYPDGSIEKYKYNEAGYIIKEEKANGQNIIREYDKRNNLITVKEEIEYGKYSITTYEYDKKGRVIKKVDPNKNEYIYSYKDDFVHMPTQIRNPDKSIITFEYDEVGRKISETIDDARTEYVYTSQDSIAKIIDPLGNITQMHYNPMNKLIIKILPNEQGKKGLGKYYKYEYDSFDRETKVIDPEGNVFAKKLDNWGRVLKEINPNTYDEKLDDGEGIRYEYDSEGRKIKVIYPDGGILRIKYDSNGNKIKEILPQNYDPKKDDGVGTTYTYDSKNRLSTIRDAYGNVIKKYIYNEVDQVIKEINAKGYKSGKDDESRYGILYKYNKAGWLIAKYEPKTIDEKSGQVLYKGTFYKYDKNGNVIEEIKSGEYLLENEKPTKYNTIKYKYDSMNRVIIVEDSTGAY